MPYQCTKCGQEHLNHYNSTETSRHAIIFSEREETPTGDRHLHFLLSKGRWEWIVRTGKNSRLCGTKRCRPVTITEVSA